MIKENIIQSLVKDPTSISVDERLSKFYFNLETNEKLSVDNVFIILLGESLLTLINNNKRGKNEKN